MVRMLHAVGAAVWAQKAVVVAVIVLIEQHELHFASSQFTILMAFRARYFNYRIHVSP